MLHYKILLHILALKKKIKNWQLRVQTRMKRRKRRNRIKRGKLIQIRLAENFLSYIIDSIET